MSWKTTFWINSSENKYNYKSSIVLYWLCFFTKLLVLIKLTCRLFVLAISKGTFSILLFREGLYIDTQFVWCIGFLKTFNFIMLNSGFLYRTNIYIYIYLNYLFFSVGGWSYYLKLRAYLRMTTGYILFSLLSNNKGLS